MSKARTRKQQASSDFGDRLRAVRLQKNMLQKDVAERAHVHVIQYGRYERGDAQPTSDVLRRLADVLGVSGDYLLNGSNEHAAKATFADLELLQLFQEVEKFPDKEKDAVKDVLGAFVVRRKLHNMTAAS